MAERKVVGSLALALGFMLLFGLVTTGLKLRAGENGALSYDGTETTAPLSASAGTPEVTMEGPSAPLVITPGDARAPGRPEMETTR